MIDKHGLGGLHYPRQPTAILMRTPRLGKSPPDTYIQHAHHYAFIEPICQLQHMQIQILQANVQPLQH